MRRIGAGQAAISDTEGILVLHNGRIVFERYCGVLKPYGHHISFSITKSFVGTIAAALIEEGTLDADARVATYVPELKDSAFGAATVRELMDMTTGIRFNEDLPDPNADAWEASRADIVPRPPD